VTPFSNAATICSYPRFCVEGPMPADTSTAALDRYFAAENAGQAIDVPTAVGFCMFVRRDCIDEVGMFDAERFGRGYGEENDFCMRARATGWRHVLALDTFVRHSGGTSFGAEKPARVQQAQELLAELHPDYTPAVARHLREDPARTARLKVDLARMRASGLPSVLFVSHVGGGGTERHQRELAEALAGRVNVLLLRPAGGDHTVLEWLRAGEGFQLAFRLPGEHEALLQALRALGVAHVHFHHSRGHSSRVLELPQSLGVACDFTAHDFFAACPQVTLSDEIGRYCGEFGAEQCGACLKRRPAPGGASIESWRAEHGRLLEQARYVLAPSADAASRLRRYFPSINAVHVPHLDIEMAPAAPAPQPLAGARPLRVVVMGALSQIKGADVFEATAALASQRGSRLEFHLVGYAYRDLRVVPGAHLTVHGEYAEKDLAGLLQALRPDVAWFPALWPETYSYTLSAALSARLPVVAPDLGAFPERLSGRPWTWVCPWYWLSEEWVQFFERLVSMHFDPGLPPERAPLRPTEAPAFSYARDYLRNVHRPALAASLPTEFLQEHRATGNP
jgi:glycosyltransferase involved in cell wall biosynthesis